MRRKEGNKEKDILEAAVKVIAAVGFHNAKISKIAKVAGVATGSVYSYYKNKDDLLATIFNMLRDNFYKNLIEITASNLLSPIEKINAFLDLIFDAFIEKPSLALVYVNEENNLARINNFNLAEYHDKFFNEIEIVFNEAKNNGELKDNLDPKIFRYYLFGAIRYLLGRWAADPESFPIDKIRQNVKHLIKHGIMKV